jgi:hypothetical protein
MNRLKITLSKIKQWFLHVVIARFSYGRWIKLREYSKDKYNEKLCYCGHTYKCSCSNPDKQLFRESVKRGSIILGDKNNGWENVL